MHYIECINVDYKSTRKESFYGMLFFTTVFDLEPEIVLFVQLM